MKGAWLCLLGLLGLHGGSALAASGVICLDQVTGESARTAGCVDVLAWSWGAINSGGTSPQVGVQDFSFTKPSDSASDDLFGLLVTSTMIKGATFSEYEDSCGSGCSADPYLTIKFNNVNVSSFQTGNSAGAGRATDNATLSFGSATYCYAPTVNNVVGTPQCQTYTKP